LRKLGKVLMGDVNLCVCRERGGESEASQKGKLDGEMSLSHCKDVRVLLSPLIRFALGGAESR